MNDIKFYKLDAACTNLQKFDFSAEPDDIIEVSFWRNGEGFDVHVNSHREQSFNLTWGEYVAIKKLVKELHKKEDTN